MWRCLGRPALRGSERPQLCEQEARQVLSSWVCSLLVCARTMCACVHFSEDSSSESIYLVLLKEGKSPVIKMETSLGILVERGLIKGSGFELFWKGKQRRGMQSEVLFLQSAGGPALLGGLHKASTMSCVPFANVWPGSDESTGQLLQPPAMAAPVRAQSRAVADARSTGPPPSSCFLTLHWLPTDRM